MSDAPVLFETLGCRLNSYETEAMKTLAHAAGVQNAVVINTCAVTGEAVRSAKQKIRRKRRENPDARIVVTGCAAQIDPEVFASMDEVDLVIGNDEKLKSATWAGLSDGTAQTGVNVGDIMAATRASTPFIDGLGTRARAYVEVQNGCDHRCTFCIIPFGRGNSRSVPAQTVVTQMKRLVARGFNEVVLTGVDMTSWGADLSGAPRLGDLVQRILAEVPDLARLRISSIDSIEVDPALMDAISSERRLMPHLHLSLQAGDNMILKRMKRRHSREDAIAFCEAARRGRPDIVFGADIIAGFPTETDKMFENSLKLVADCGLTWLHVFPYSVRQGTPAARMPQVGGEVIKERAAQLRDCGAMAVTRYLAAQSGQRANILMENARMGRTEGFAPVSFATDQPVGQIVVAEIVGAKDGRLLV